jgi:RNA polymerase sigma factor (sigma-70 family)
MPGPGHEQPDTGVLAERRHLMALAFRMLGTVAEAEDAVQETYARWYKLSPAERGAIQSPAAWLTRVASRVCLDVLGSAHARRERYVGPWLPEPVPAAAFPGIAADPAERATLDDSVSTALLVVLESMTPAERVSFVLHDVFAVPFGEIAQAVGRSPAACRQLAASARRRVQASRARQVPRAEHDRVVRAFAAAARAGDIQSLIRALDPAVVLRSDGGGIVTAALNPVEGAARVARMLLGLLAKAPTAEVLEQDTGDGLGLTVCQEGRVISVVTVEVGVAGVTEVRIVVNPRKLSLWTLPAPAAASHSSVLSRRVWHEHPQQASGRGTTRSHGRLGRPVGANRACVLL